MNKMMVAVFDTETDAYKGLNAMKDLHKNGDITLYATSVVVKDIDGEVEVKQAADDGPIGTALGMLTGGLIGLAGGPAGAAVGTMAAYAAAGSTIGGTTGLLFDLGYVGVNAEFLDDVSEILIPGKSAVLAEVDEDWITPVDSKIEQLGGIVFRRPRYEVVDDQLFRESEAFKTEMQDIRKELETSRVKTNGAVKKTLKSVQKRLHSIAAKVDTQLDQVNKEAEAKIRSLHSQIKRSGESQKAKIEERIAEIKAKQKERSQKLQKARKLTGEALAL